MILRFLKLIVGFFAIGSFASLEAGFENPHRTNGSSTTLTVEHVEVIFDKGTLGKTIKWKLTDLF